jgi:hypothetical protein
VHGHSRDSAERFGLRAPGHRHVFAFSREIFVADVETSIEDEVERDVDTGNGGGGASLVVIVEVEKALAHSVYPSVGTRENLLSLGDLTARFRWAESVRRGVDRYPPPRSGAGLARTG